MQITVLAFAAARDAVGAARVELDVPPGATAEMAVAALAETRPRLRELVSSLRLAVNEEFASANTPLAPGSTLALLPPMSGG